MIGFAKDYVVNFIDGAKNQALSGHGHGRMAVNNITTEGARLLYNKFWKNRDKGESKSETNSEPKQKANSES